MMLLVESPARFLVSVASFHGTMNFGPPHGIEINFGLRTRPWVDEDEDGSEKNDSKQNVSAWRAGLWNSKKARSAWIDVTLNSCDVELQDLQKDQKR